MFAVRAGGKPRRAIHAFVAGEPSGKRSAPNTGRRGRSVSSGVQPESRASPAQHSDRLPGRTSLVHLAVRAPAHPGLSVVSDRIEPRRTQGRSKPSAADPRSPARARVRRGLHAGIHAHRALGQRRGSVFNDYKDWIARIGGAVIIILGLDMVACSRFRSCDGQTADRAQRQPFAARIVPGGLGFAAGWSPCIGPIFRASFCSRRRSRSARRRFCSSSTRWARDPVLAHGGGDHASARIAQQDQALLGAIEVRRRARSSSRPASCSSRDRSRASRGSFTST